VVISLTLISGDIGNDRIFTGDRHGALKKEEKRGRGRKAFAWPWTFERLSRFRRELVEMLVEMLVECEDGRMKKRQDWWTSAR
jgi:hypothetical protein